MAEYGPVESNRTEGWALALFYLGLLMWVAALAYGSSWIQPVCGLVGFGLDVYAVILLYNAKRAAVVS